MTNSGKLLNPAFTPVQSLAQRRLLAACGFAINNVTEPPNLRISSYPSGRNTVHSPLNR